jgi:large subunit ribosomal protein L22
MEIKAHANNLRMSSRKVKLVIDLIRGKAVGEAETILRFNDKLAAGPVLKLLLSAIANAEHNFKLKREDLMVKSIVANQGPVLKRMRPRAFGRGSGIKKRTCHVSIVLEDKK